MSLANFFNKTALSASQILQDFNYESFSNILEKHKIGIVFDSLITKSGEALITLEFVCNQVARLYPSIALIPIDDGLENYTNTLKTLIQNINPAIDIADETNVTAFIVIGNTKVDTNCPAFYIGSDGWIAKLSIEKPIGSGKTSNPLGASAAACIACANLFRYVFSDFLENPELDTFIEFSLFDYNYNVKDFENPELPNMDLGTAYLVGVGAIGNAAMWVLSKFTKLEGTLHLIDPENVELSNLQRYVLTLQEHIDSIKVDLATSIISETGLAVNPHKLSWGEYLANQTDWNFDTVLVALDTAEQRRNLQASLPQYIINSWTQAGDVGISRHKFDDNKACLMCLYFPDHNMKSHDKIVADAINLPDAHKEVGALLYTHQPLHKEFLVRIANANNIPFEAIQQFEGQSLDVFYSQAVCGGLLLQYQDSAKNPQQTEVPMVFQSAFAGLLLVADWISHATGLRATRKTKTAANLMRPLTPYSQNIPKYTHGQCICQDEDYLSVYKSKYK